MITKIIFKKMKQGMGNLKFRTNGAILDVNITRDDKITSKINAQTELDGKNVHFNVNINTNDSLEKIYHILLQTVRHELEHVEQIRREGQFEPAYDSRNIEKEMETYLTDPHEIGAIATEVYLNAKKTHRFIDDAIKDRSRSYIRVMASDGLDNDEIVRIIRRFRGLLFKEIQRRFPKAKFEADF
jgi:hypothetical protein